MLAGGQLFAFAPPNSMTVLAAPSMVSAPRTCPPGLAARRPRGRARAISLPGSLALGEVTMSSSKRRCMTDSCVSRSDFQLDQMQARLLAADTFDASVYEALWPSTMDTPASTKVVDLDTPLLPTPQRYNYTAERELNNTAGGFSHLTLRWCHETGETTVRKRPVGGLHAATMLAHEVALLTQVKHPHIVQLLDSSEDEAVFEYAPHGDLGVHIRRNGPLEPSAVVMFAHQLCNALHYLHAKLGVVHGDLSLANVLVFRKDLVKLADFGLATTRNSRQTVLDHGVIHYAAPELARNRPFSPASDMWAMGCIIFELITGVKPFGSDMAPAAIGLDLGISSSLGEKAPALVPELLRRNQLEGFEHPLLPAVARCLCIPPEQRCTANELMELLPLLD